ncbi:hypothetical protein [Streptomyces sp. SID5473]|uniref:hypothetical protein n=1 Tax=Streptomyces sp. SID5473 TaxID=2690299 RepID=UPI00025CE3EA|nr:hypothetical protein [Streptomyces sp. SID5473]EIF88363.1 hypothetical protein [Streptomyces tsukubensis NRRL18488]
MAAVQGVQGLREPGVEDMGGGGGFEDGDGPGGSGQRAQQTVQRPRGQGVGGGRRAEAVEEGVSDVDGGVVAVAVEVGQQAGVAGGGIVGGVPARVAVQGCEGGRGRSFGIEQIREEGSERARLLSDGLGRRPGTGAV